MERGILFAVSAVSQSHRQVMELKNDLSLLRARGAGKEKTQQKAFDILLSEKGKV